MYHIIAEKIHMFSICKQRNGTYFCSVTKLLKNSHIKNIHIFQVLWWWILKMQFMTITWNISVISPILNQHGLCRCFIKILCVGDWVMLTPSLYSGYFKWTSLVVSTSVFLHGEHCAMFISMVDKHIGVIRV